MKKLSFLIGVVVGFVLGSKTGHEPYERLEAQFRQLARRPEVKSAVDAVVNKASDLTDSASGAVVEKMNVGREKAKSGGPTGSIDQSGVDLQAEAALDDELADTFPTSDPPSHWAGADI